MLCGMTSCRAVDPTQHDHGDLALRFSFYGELSVVNRPSLVPWEADLCVRSLSTESFEKNRNENIDTSTHRPVDNDEGNDVIKYYLFDAPTQNDFAILFSIGWQAFSSWKNYTSCR